jgi:prefoldin subunit 5
VAETKLEEHQRLQHRTDELRKEHAALDLHIRPFDQAEHDAHNADLEKHKVDLLRHQERRGD